MTNGVPKPDVSHSASCVAKRMECAQLAAAFDHLKPPVPLEHSTALCHATAAASCAHSIRFARLGSSHPSFRPSEFVIHSFPRCGIIRYSSFSFTLMLAVVAPQAAWARTNPITLAPDGAWTWFNDPRAIYDNGALYFGYERNGDGRTVLSAFQPSTAHRADLWPSTQTEKDDHDNPALLPNQDARNLTVYSRHTTAH